jgi:hypothetical protein
MRTLHHADIEAVINGAGAAPVSRIQARAIRLCGELLREIEPSKGGRPARVEITRDGGDPSFTHTQAARDAGLSTRQQKINTTQPGVLGRATTLAESKRPAQGANQNIRDGDGPNVTRKSAARDAGLSEWQQKTALRVACVPAEEMEVDNPSLSATRSRAATGCLEQSHQRQGGPISAKITGPPIAPLRKSELLWNPTKLAFAL